GGQPGMVGQRRPALVTEPLGRVLDLLARQAVDDAGIAALALEELLQLLTRTVLGHDAVEDIRPIEAGDETTRLLQSQPLGDFFPGALIRGGRERHARYAREQFLQLTHLQVFRTEVVPPLGYAVRLVDG